MMSDIELAFLCIGVLIASILIGLAVDKYVNQGRILASIYQLFYGTESRRANDLVMSETYSPQNSRGSIAYVLIKLDNIGLQSPYKLSDYALLDSLKAHVGEVAPLQWNSQNVDQTLERLNFHITNDLTNYEEVYLVGKGVDGWFSIVAAQYIAYNCQTLINSPFIRVMAIDPVVTENCMNGQAPLLGSYADHYNFHVYTSSDDLSVEQCYGGVASVHPINQVNYFFAQFENKNE
jgi:hypothetical protein